MAGSNGAWRHRNQTIAYLRFPRRFSNMILQGPHCGAVVTALLAAREADTDKFTKLAA